MTSSNGEFTLDTDGLLLRGWVAGDGPVLVVQGPGWGIGCGLYRQSLGPLEREFTVIYYDTRGSGQSGTPKDAADINAGAMVDDLEALRIYLGIDSFALLGHSHGGFLLPIFLAILYFIDRAAINEDCCLPLPD